MNETKINGKTLSIIKGDITNQKTEVIVNAANSSLMGGSGVDGAIHRAGGPAILEECKKIVEKQGRLPASKAVITTGGSLKAKYVIHTVGPIYKDGNQNEAETLRNCYLNSLRVAKENGIKTISFPSISTGAYRYPVKSASQIALKAVIDFLNENNEVSEVVFVLFDDKTYRVYAEALSELAKDFNW